MHVRSSRIPGAVRFYLAFAAIVLTLVAFEAFLTSLPFADAIPDYAEQLQQRQLDSYFEMIQLLITLATVTIGGITGYVINRDKTKRLSHAQLRRVIASWGLCAASLYFARDQHWTAAGHELAARTMADWLKGSGLVPAS